MNGSRDTVNRACNCYYVSLTWRHSNNMRAMNSINDSHGRNIDPCHNDTHVDYVDQQTKLVIPPIDPQTCFFWQQNYEHWWVAACSQETNLHLVIP